MNQSEQIADLARQIEELKALLMDKLPVQPTSNLLPLSEAAILLVNAKSRSDRAGQRRLLRLVGDHYRIGKEVIDRRQPTASVPVYWFDMLACKTRDLTPPERRKPAKK